MLNCWHSEGIRETFLYFRDEEKKMHQHHHVTENLVFFRRLRHFSGLKLTTMQLLLLLPFSRLNVPPIIVFLFQLKQSYYNNSSRVVHFLAIASSEETFSDKRAKLSQYSTVLLLLLLQLSAREAARWIAIASIAL